MSRRRHEVEFLLPVDDMLPVSTRYTAVIIINFSLFFNIFIFNFVQELVSHNGSDDWQAGIQHTGTLARIHWSKEVEKKWLENLFHLARFNGSVSFSCLTLHFCLISLLFFCCCSFHFISLRPRMKYLFRLFFYILPLLFIFILFFIQHHDPAMYIVEGSNGKQAKNMCCLRRRSWWYQYQDAWKRVIALAWSAATTTINNNNGIVGSDDGIKSAQSTQV